MVSVACRVTVGCVSVTWSSVKEETGASDRAHISSPVPRYPGPCQ